MADKEDRNDDAVYKVDTVPPPDGDDDAYSAPTRIGPMASAVVNELIMAKSRESAEVAAASQVKPRIGENSPEEALDENDIEAELAFPPPPKLPGAPPSKPRISAPPPPKPSSAPQVKTQPLVPLTPLSSIKPTAAQAPASSPRPKVPAIAEQKGLSPTMLAGGAIALLVVVGILYMLVRH
jgi:hypothetical protein